MEADAEPQDRHPVSRLGGTLSRVPRYLRLGKALLQDPGLSRPRKAALAAGIAYLASPIDLVPGFIPVAGQLDDLAVALLALRAALRGLSPVAASRHMEAVGLSQTVLDADIDNVRAGAVWLARTVAGATRTAMATSVRLVGSTAGSVGSAARRRWRARRR